MIKYFSFIKELQINNIVKKKALNNLLFKKSIIRNSLVKRPNLYLVDNYTKISIFNTYKTQKSFSFINKYKDLAGLSINTKEIQYVHNFNSFLKFKMDTIFFNNIKTGFLNSIYTFLDILIAFRAPKTKKIKKLLSQKKKIKEVNLLLLKPIKGGFLAYSLGFKGFFPLKHIHNYLDLIVYAFRNYVTQARIAVIRKRKMFLFRFVEFSTFKKNSNPIFRFPVLVIEVRIFLPVIARKYSKNKSIRRRRKRKSSNSITLVFLTNLHQQKPKLKEVNASSTESFKDFPADALFSYPIKTLP